MIRSQAKYVKDSFLLLSSASYYATTYSKIYVVNKEYKWFLSLSLAFTFSFILLLCCCLSFCYLRFFSFCRHCYHPTFFLVRSFLGVWWGKNKIDEKIMEKCRIVMKHEMTAQFILKTKMKVIAANHDDGKKDARESESFWQHTKVEN